MASTGTNMPTQLSGPNSHVPTSGSRSLSEEFKAMINLEVLKDGLSHLQELRDTLVVHRDEILDNFPPHPYVSAQAFSKSVSSNDVVTN
jgi:hypothetical protein